MTVKDLIEKLKTMPPNAAIDDAKCPCEPLDVYLLEGRVYIKRRYER